VLTSRQLTRRTAAHLSNDEDSAIRDTLALVQHCEALGHHCFGLCDQPSRRSVGDGAQEAAGRLFPSANCGLAPMRREAAANEFDAPGRGAAFARLCLRE